jgi:hypothetical protein
MIEHEGIVFHDELIRPYELTRRAIQNFKNNECEVVICYGMPEGVGKSAYVNHALADAQGFLACHDWDKLQWMFKKNEERTKDTVIWEADYEAAKDLIKYKPEDVVSWLADFLKTGRRVPLWHWDDGGTWLNTMEYNDDFVKAFMQFLPLARSVCGLVVISTPVEEWVLKKLHTASGVIHAPVIKTAGETHLFRPRRCKAYKKVRYPTSNRYWPQWQWVDDYPAIMPDTFYRWYKPVRDHYALLSVLKMQHSLARKKAQGSNVGLDEEVMKEIADSIQVANGEAVKLKEIIAQKTA